MESARIVEIPEANMEVHAKTQLQVSSDAVQDLGIQASDLSGYTVCVRDTSAGEWTDYATYDNYKDADKDLVERANSNTEGKPVERLGPDPSRRKVEL